MSRLFMILMELIDLVFFSILANFASPSFSKNYHNDKRKKLSKTGYKIFYCIKIGPDNRLLNSIFFDRQSSSY